MHALPRQSDRIAFVMSRRIGDTLISMVMVRNLVAHGYDVTIFSAHLMALRDWFPGFTLRPAIPDDQARATLGDFDIVLHAYAKDVAGDTRAWHPNCWVFNEWPLYLAMKPMIDLQLDVCRDVFAIAAPINDNGLVVPAGVTSVVTPHRVVIHPTASEPHKQWLPARFLRVASLLRDQGYTVCFVVAPGERDAWSWVQAEGFELVAKNTLAELAAWLRGAGVLIGNDSGVAHLASNVGVPTVSLAKRRRIALRWTPGWAASRAVTPLSLLPGGRVREAYWKQLLPVFKVTRALRDLQREVAGTSRAFAPQAFDTAPSGLASLVQPLATLRGNDGPGHVPSLPAVNLPGVSPP